MVPAGCNLFLPLTMPSSRSTWPQKRRDADLAFIDELSRLRKKCKELTETLSSSFHEVEEDDDVMPSSASSSSTATLDPFSLRRTLPHPQPPSQPQLPQTLPHPSPLLWGFDSPNAFIHEDASGKVALPTFVPHIQSKPKCHHRDRKKRASPQGHRHQRSPDPNQSFPLCVPLTGPFLPGPQPLQPTQGQPSLGSPFRGPPNVPQTQSTGTPYASGPGNILPSTPYQQMTLGGGSLSPYPMEMCPTPTWSFPYDPYAATFPTIFPWGYHQQQQYQPRLYQFPNRIAPSRRPRRSKRRAGGCVECIEAWLLDDED